LPAGWECVLFGPSNLAEELRESNASQVLGPFAARESLWQTKRKLLRTKNCWRSTKSPRRILRSSRGTNQLHIACLCCGGRYPSAAGAGGCARWLGTINSLPRGNGGVCSSGLRTVGSEVIGRGFRNNLRSIPDFLPSRLLASAAVGEPVHPSYVKIMAELTAAEGKVLIC
jgi:hypothetical protein